MDHVDPGPGWTAWALPLGAALDALIGDPRGWPHPVRAIGWLIARLDRGLRALLARQSAGPLAGKVAGVALVAVVVAATAGSAWAIVAAADRLGGPFPLLARSVLVFWGLATRSLRDEALRASEAPDLPSARREVAMIVGRDTDRLDWPDVRRACVETIGENANDGVIAPIFWYAVGGPVGLWAFKAVNTLDSMVGYRHPPYRDLGWASARLDDVLGYLPARLTWLLTALAALVAGEHPLPALRIGLRDGRKHPSPNSAWGEASMAGALGVQLGGLNFYRGQPSPKPLLGDPGPPIDARVVRRAARVMTIAAWTAVLLAWSARAGWFGLP